MSEMFSYEFMRNAGILILIISPLFGLLSTLIVNNKLAYFSDALGHSAYMGIGLGILIGLTTNSTLSIMLFSVIFSILLVLIKRKFKESQDTIIGIISSISIGLGIMILSNYGGIGKFSNLLVGDLLLVKKDELIYLFGIAVVVAIIFMLIYKRLILVNLDSSLARSKNINPTVYEILFNAIIAITVSISINIMGILIINALFILPGATSKNISKNLKGYLINSVVISMISSISGLIASYYLSVPTGSCIVVICGIIYLITSLSNLKNQNL